MGEIAIALGVISVIVSIAAVKYAEIRYGSKNTMSELAERLDTLDVYVAKVKKEQLHERLSRVETATGVKLF